MRTWLDATATSCFVLARMKTVACSNMPFVREAFSTLGDVTTLDGRAIAAEHVRDADLLAIRSTTQVDAALLDNSRVRFVGTATIGTDHLDVPYLEMRQIPWCSAPGCNANSVGEYLVSALLCLAVRHGFSLRGKTLGVVGVGNVGRCVVAKARALGLRVLQNDPPRQRSEPENAAQFVSLDHIRRESDILSFHVPLTQNAPDATQHIAGRRFFEGLRPGATLVNASRGAVLDTDALLSAMNDGTVRHAVIDTWEDEPRCRPDLLDRVDLATPHIAGHSFEGKVMGTVMVYREACRVVGVEPAWSHEPLMPHPPVSVVNLTAAGRTFEQVLWDAVRPVYDIQADDARLRDAAGDRDARARHFDALRKNYPMRREFRYTTVRVRDADERVRTALKALEFRVEEAPDASASSGASAVH